MMSLFEGVNGGKYIIGYLQKSLNELSDMVVKQGKVIEHLERQNMLLQSALETEIVKPLSEETPPPHY